MTRENFPKKNKFILYYKENQILTQEKVFLEENKTSIIVTKTSNFDSIQKINFAKIEAIVIDTEDQKKINKFTKDKYVSLELSQKHSNLSMRRTHNY